MSTPLLEGIQPMGLTVALMLPWLTGSAVVAALLPDERPSIVLGHGYLAGLMAVIATLQLMDFFGMPLGFIGPAMVLGAIAILAVVTWWRRGGRVRSRRPERPALSTLLWVIPFLFFLLERGGTLAQELALRPLFAWDAWMNWVPRAVVWFHHETLTPFVAPPEWLARSAEEVVYTLGNRQASEYPKGVPLLLLWHMLGAGTADHSLLYLPWLVLPAAVALALWGHLRESGAHAAVAAMAVFALLSLPLFNIHAALAGYADLWLAGAFGLGAMALSSGWRAQRPAYLVLVVIAALACAGFKTPGLVFGGILLAIAAAEGLGLADRPRSLAALGFLGSAMVVLLLGWLLPAGVSLEGFSLPLPWTRPELEVVLAPLLPYLLESAVLDANWHLLWPSFALILVATSGLEGRRSFEDPALLALMAGLAFLVAIFGLTDYFRQVENGVTFNRALLYIVPLMVFVTFRGLSRCFELSTHTEEGVP